MSVCSATLAGMGQVFFVLRVLLGWFRPAGLRLFRGLLPVLVWLSSLLCAVGVMGGCGAADEPVPSAHQKHHECVREVCWNPPEFQANTPYFTFPLRNGEAVATPDYSNLCAGVGAHEFILKYSENAPVANLRLIPLSRPEAWCTRIPQPTEEKVRRLLEVCPSPETMPLEGGQSIAKNLLGQTEVSIRSSLFCDKYPRMTPTTQEALLMRARNTAYLEAYEHARATAMALTKANAEAERVTNQSDGALKRLLVEDPGTLEQIQQNLADALDSIEVPPEYDDPILEQIALAGFQAGFEDGKFEVEAKLFAIDAGIVILELVALEVALGPLGGAKLLASAASKGAKALTAAVKRLENVPIFLPLAAGGAGGFVRAGAVVGSMSARMHRYWLEKAMKVPPFNRFRQAGESLHHMVAHGDDRAEIARKILDKFKINIDEGWNGVYLPATKNSPNPKGSIVHSMVHSDAYYAKVEFALKGAKSRKDAIRILQRIRETLENGTFFHAHL